MVKFITVAVMAVVAVASVQAVDPQQETPPPAELAPCAPVNFQEKSLDFAELNDLIKIAIEAGMLSEGLQKIEPMSFENKTLGAFPMELLNLNFSVAPTIKALELTGLSTLTPRQFEVASPENIKFGLDFNGTVGLKTTVTLEITQLNRKKWHPCWTDLIHPNQCRPKVFNLQLEAAASNPSIGVNLLMSMLQCPPNSQAGTCTDLTVSDFITAAATKEFDSFSERLFRRVKTMSITEVSVAVEQVTELNFHFEKSGPLMLAFFDKIARFNKDRFNKKEDMYEEAIEKVEEKIQALGQEFIHEVLQPKFGNTCYGDWNWSFRSHLFNPIEIEFQFD